MTPTYQLYHGDCLDIMPTLGAESVDAVITDPPYGINLKTSYKSSQRSSLAPCNDFKPIIGDSLPFDPTPFLPFSTVVLFGANYFANALATNGTFHVWDKLDGLQSHRDWGFNDNSDCEFIWTNKKEPSRIIRHRWMGAIKGSEQGKRRVHPTQKPIALMEKLILRYTKKGDTILDPFAGSGSTGVAAMRTGRNFIGIELDADYFAIAEQRIKNAAGDYVMTEKEKKTGQMSIFEAVNS